MKLWLDDRRPAPSGWTRAYSVAEAQRYLTTGLVEEASLDHDLGACDRCLGGLSTREWLRDPRLRHAHLRAPWNRLHAMPLDGADRPLAEKDAGGAFDERGWRGSHESRHPPSVLTARAARMTSCSPSHASSARVAGETLDARDDADAVAHKRLANAALLNAIPPS
jgi:hypothetical protein